MRAGICKDNGLSSDDEGDDCCRGVGRGVYRFMEYLKYDGSGDGGDEDCNRVYCCCWWVVWLVMTTRSFRTSPRYYTKDGDGNDGMGPGSVVT